MILFDKNYNGYNINSIIFEIMILSDNNQFNKIVKRYIRVGYNLDIMRQSAGLV